MTFKIHLRGGCCIHNTVETKPKPLPEGLFIFSKFFFLRKVKVTHELDSDTLRQNK